MKFSGTLSARKPNTNRARRRPEVSPAGVFDAYSGRFDRLPDEAVIVPGVQALTRRYVEPWASNSKIAYSSDAAPEVPG